MSENLYFVALIGRALRHPDPKSALKKAFEEIEALGRLPEYEKGFVQFQRFMAEVKRNWEKPSEDLEDVLAQPGRLHEFGKLLDDLAYRVLEIVVERDGEPIDTLQCRRVPVTKHVKNVRPGKYVVRLSTGRVIWEEELTVQELVWEHAFPEQPLRLAADTESAVERASREARVLNGEVTIRVFPGAESGSLELKFRGSSVG